ncbi:tetratricopeptide repeat protein [candidate division WOR-3 bacterium]|nr:tetratricopeptide repeat protein [candidate division WOR-3 bacterium]
MIERQIDEILDSALRKIDTDPAQALELAEKVFREVKKGGSKGMRKKACRVYAKALARNGEYRTAIEIFEEAIQFIEDDKRTLAENYKDIGLSNYYICNYEKALEVIDKALEIAEALGDDGLIAQSLNNRGLVFVSLGKNKEAHECFAKSLELKESIENYSLISIANTLSSIGDLHEKTGEIYRAFDFHERALKLYRKSGNISGVAAQLCNIGICFQELKKHEEAMKSFDEALSLARKINHREFEANILYNSANSAGALGDMKRAKLNLQQSMKINQLLGDVQSLANIKVEFASIKMNEKKYDEALELLNEAQEIGQRINEKPLIMKIFEMVSRIYEIKNEYNKSLEYYKKYMEIKECIRDRR